MFKVSIRYYSPLNLCWTEKEIEFDTREEAEEYIDESRNDHRVAWAFLIEPQPI